jgi:UrcA family protein
MIRVWFRGGAQLNFRRAAGIARTTYVSPLTYAAITRNRRTNTHSRIKVFLTVGQIAHLLWFGLQRILAPPPINPSLKKSTDMSHKTTIKSQINSMAAVLTAGVIVFAGVAMGGTARAAETQEYDQTVISFGDLNLDSQQGTKALYARLRNGAEGVCSSVEGRDLFFRRLWQTCFDRAVTAAVAEVNNPRLTSLHNQAVARSKGDR